MPAATSICKELMKHYFDCGRTLTVDNFYTSLALAELCLQRKTHLQGTLRANRKGFPKFDSKMKKGESRCCEKNGVVCGIWKDKREVRFVSTKQCGTLVEAPKRNYRRETVLKPNIIISYNQCKKGVDLSDQFANYYSPLRKTIKWYHKLAFELLLNTAMVNAYILHGKASKKNIPYLKFREEVILSLTGEARKLTKPSVQTAGDSHNLKETTEKTATNRKRRHRCIKCYSEMSRTKDAPTARKRAKTVTTFCSQCPNSPFLCIKHFNEEHEIQAT